MNKLEIRNILSPKDQKLFDKIENHELLGATNHIQVIGDMIEHLTENPLDDIEIVKNKIKKMTQYYIGTRGQASQAITNAILLMIKNLDTHETVEQIIAQKDKYFEDTEKNKKKILNYAVELSKRYRTIMCYDYSSTVKDFLVLLAADETKRTLYLPESRVINGGKPYVEALINQNYDFKFIPDSAIYYYMDHCDACFMGAETFYADGTGFNTIGSDIVGLACSYWHKPLYFITPMIKLDVKSFYGYQKALVINDLKEKMTKDWRIDGKVEKINFSVPELIGVESQFITSFITEYGVTPASQMYGVSEKYAETIYGGFE